MSARLAIAVGALTAALLAAVPATALDVTGMSALWHGSSLTRLPAQQARAPGPAERLGNLAYDGHFIRLGYPPEWPFLLPLQAPDPHVARIEGDRVLFVSSGAEVHLSKDVYPDVATPAATFLLSAPRGDRVLIVQPYYMFRDKATRYVVSVHDTDGVAGPSFNSLPTHALAGDPGILVAPERAGCCENMTWSIRFYDLQSGSMTTFDCPPGRCGDLVLARHAGTGDLILGVEQLETRLGQGVIVETRLAVVSPGGREIVGGRLVFAARDNQFGMTGPDIPCANRTLVAVRSPYALSNLVSAEPAAGGAWVFRFATPSGEEAWSAAAPMASERPVVRFPSTP